MVRHEILVRAMSDFGRARKKAIVNRMLGFFRAQKDEMLSLKEVRSLLRPESEYYRGMQTVAVSKIAGSEGRARDFTRAFLPRHDRMMDRWIRVDMAHYQDIILPPIKLFEIGGLYFVRDGNHRVSVAKSQGLEFIDAEVVSLTSQISIHPDMTLSDLRRAVIEFEKKRFFEETKLDRMRPGCRLEFTEIGRYDEIMNHIREHKWFLNLRKAEEIPFAEAMCSWYDNVYLPIVRIIDEESLLSRFLGATEGDLYVFIGKHWAELSRKYGSIFTLEEAAEDLSTRPRTGLLSRVLGAMKGRFHKSPAKRK
jgi:hypothetical protein